MVTNKKLKNPNKFLKVQKTQYCSKDHRVLWQKLLSSHPPTICAPLFQNVAWLLGNSCPVHNSISHPPCFYMRPRGLLPMESDRYHFQTVRVKKQVRFHHCPSSVSPEGRRQSTGLWNPMDDGAKPWRVLKLRLGGQPLANQDRAFVFYTSQKSLPTLACHETL